MEYRRLGRSGLKLSEIGLGSWLTYGGYVDRSTSLSCMKAALEEGINYFDTADVYGDGEAERILGELLSETRRRDVVVGSKCFFATGEGPNDEGLSRKHVVESLAESLDRLGLRYLDIFYCHRYDPETPLEEVIDTMTSLVHRGMILYWGVSMWSAAQIARCCSVARAMHAVAPIVNQPAYNLFERTVEREVLPVSTADGVGQVTFSPLAQGVLTGKYAAGRIPDGSRATRKGGAGRFIRRYLEPERLETAERLRNVATQAGLTMGQLAIAFCLRLPAVSSVIMGASSPDQVRENVRASGLRLSEGLLEQIEGALAGEEEK